MNETAKCPKCQGAMVATTIYEGICIYPLVEILCVPCRLKVWYPKGTDYIRDLARRTPPPVTAAFLAAFRRACPTYLSDYSDVDIIFKAGDIRAALAEWPREGQ